MLLLYRCCVWGAGKLPSSCSWRADTSRRVGPKGWSARLRFQMDAAKEGVVAVQADQVSGEKLGVGVGWWVVSCHTVAAAGGGGLGGGCIWGGVLG